MFRLLSRPLLILSAIKIQSIVWAINKLSDRHFKISAHYINYNAYFYMALCLLSGPY